MKVSKRVWLTAAAIGLFSGAAANAQQPAQQRMFVPQARIQNQGQMVLPPSHGGAPRGAMAPCDCGEVVCGCEAADTPEITPDCGCAASCDGGCDGSCGGGFGGGARSGLAKGLQLDPRCCDLGAPLSLFGQHGGIRTGGWIQMGYHNRSLPLFNQHPHNYNLHQAWLYAEKAIDTSNGFDIGGRIDYVYGVDAQDTQAFGTDPRGWDNSWDHGIYGHALPQAYLQAGYGDLSVQVGHFFTAIGQEVIPAPDNFFYSHTYTRYHSEPFTHAGAVASYALDENVSVFGGYTLGWDSGFDDNGDNYIGGFTSTLNDYATFTYATTIGRFNERRFNDVAERGYMHSLVLNTGLTSNLRYIFHSDFLDTEDASGAVVRQTFDISQYLLYTINDCWTAGTRFEWYNQEGVFLNQQQPPGAGPGLIQESNFYALTLGVNYKPHANVLVRPEIRWDWDEDELAGLDAGERQTTFGIDTILLF